MTTYKLDAETAGLPAGEYVDAATAQTLETTLSKLVWQVLYGKQYDASTVAVSAERMLATLKSAKAPLAA